jgi:predicted anti-sigma-YlaC factor YlaD
MNCTNCEERMSDYLEDALGGADRAAVELHLHSCTACSGLLAGMTEVLAWGKTFPVYEAPAWVAPRAIAIAAHTPRVVRESWLETVASIEKWIVEPRTAMAVFTATLVLSWMGSLAGISPDWATVVRNPAAIYYGAQGAANRAYDEAVRKVYRSPLVSEIQARIEQLREIS